MYVSSFVEDDLFTDPNLFMWGMSEVRLGTSVPLCDPLLPLSVLPVDIAYNSWRKLGHVQQ